MEQSQFNINYFAQTDFRGKKTPFGIKSEDRSRHMYVIGKTGMGKSTLLENMAIQDIKNGEGMVFIDPHGKSAELLLDYVPEDRIEDVIYFAPFDLEHPIAFNVMEDVGRDQRHLVANGLMATFKKIWEDAWSARMEYILNNTLLALLEYPNSTLLGINRMLSDKDYRKKVVDNVTDPSVKAFWVDEFAKWTERFAAEATPAIQNKIGQFTSNPLIRNIIGQSRSTIDFRKVMDERKILIINLSKGRLGEDNAKLIGSMLITKIYLAAMSRANVTDAELRKLPPFYFMVDEFQNFVNDTFADILSEARKYKLCLTIAHQYIEQMPENVRNAVFGNVGTTISFRVGPFDAEVLEKVFAPTFTQEDLVNLGLSQVYLTLMIDGVGSPPFSASTLPSIITLGESFAPRIIDHSRKAYATPRAEVEKSIVDWHAEEHAPAAPERQPERRNGDAPRTPANRQPQFADRRQNSYGRRATDIQRPPAPPAVSLDALRTAQSKDTGKHKDALRSLLQGIKKPEEAGQKPSEPPVEEKPAEASKEERVATPEPRPEAERQARPERKPNGLPEDVLRKMVEVDGEKSL